MRGGQLALSRMGGMDEGRIPRGTVAHAVGRGQPPNRIVPPRNGCTTPDRLRGGHDAR